MFLKTNNRLQNNIIFLFCQRFFCISHCHHSLSPDLCGTLKLFLLFASRGFAVWKAVTLIAVGEERREEEKREKEGRLEEMRCNEHRRNQIRVQQYRKEKKCQRKKGEGVRVRRFLQKSPTVTIWSAAGVNSKQWLRFWIATICHFFNTR